MRLTREYGLLIAIWLVFGAIAMKLALLFDTAAIVDGRFIPVSNDSFYHATRILDAAVGSRGFYQFDDMIHVPEGSWVTWPWAYDYLMAKTLAVAIWFRPDIEAMKFLAYIPVAWVFVNTGLMLLICRAINLGTGLSAVALCAFALMPTTQLMHGLGVIDHHHIELTFVLLSTWLALRFFSADAPRASAISFGLVLGVAPAFHNGLFILQIPLLITFFSIWLRRTRLHTELVRTFVVSLIVGVLFAVLPSEPFWDFQFEFGTLSWFHLYIAICTASCVYFVSLESARFTHKSLLILLAVTSILAVPLILKIIQGATFISGNNEMLQQILEVKSPYRLYRNAGNSLAVTRYFSWLIVASPLVLIAFLFRASRESDTRRLCFAIYIVFSLSLLMTQFRFHPYGSWALIVGPLLLIDSIQRKLRANPLYILAPAIALLGIAYQPALKHQLFKVFPPGLSKDYAAMRSLFPVLHSFCEADPGIVLSYGDDGHLIRYHSDCSVIANNFLLTTQHLDKAQEVEELLAMTPEQLLRERTDVRYVVARLYGLFTRGPEGFFPASIEEVRSRNAPLFNGLIFRPDLPANYELLGELRVEDDRDIPFARIFKINP